MDKREPHGIRERAFRCLLSLVLVFSSVSFTTVQAAFAEGEWTADDFILVQNEAGDHVLKGFSGSGSVKISEADEMTMPSLARVEIIGGGFEKLSITKLTISSGYTAIGNKAFEGSAIAALILPEGLKTIGSKAFAGCPLTTVELPSTIESISDDAFDEGVELIVGDLATKSEPDPMITSDPAISPDLVADSADTSITPLLEVYSGLQYVTAPPSGSREINIGNTFTFSGYTGYDTEHPNVAVVSDDSMNTYGAMWGNKQLSLAESFSTEMSLYMAHNSTAQNPLVDIADGMTFTLHNDPRGLNATGGDGEGLGVYGSNYGLGDNAKNVIANAMSIEFDLYQNLDRNNVSETDAEAMGDHYMWDPSTPNNQGHCAILFPKAPLGDTRVKPADHVNNFYFAKTTDWMHFSATWEPFYAGEVLGGTLTYSFAGQTNTYTISDVTQVFGGTNVYWGFTGATGGLTSVLAAAINEWPEQAPIKTAVDEGGHELTNVAIGDEFTYAITYENYDPNEATILIKDTLPSSLDFVSAGEGGIYDEGTHTVTWMLPNVPSFEKGAVHMEVRVNEAALVKIENDATMQVGSRPPVASPVSKVTVDPRNPVKTVTDGSGGPVYLVSQNDELIYTITYENNHENTADITILDELPQEVVFSEATQGGLYDEASHTVTWELTNVPSAATGTVSVTVTVGDAAGGSEIENDATVQVGSDAPRTSNEVKNPVRPEAPKTVDVGEGTVVEAGDELVYTISYVNDTGADQEVTITDAVPAGTAFAAASGSGALDALTGTVAWPAQTVAAGEMVTVTLTVLVGADAAGEVANQARIAPEGSPSVTTNEVKNPVRPEAPKRILSTTDESVSLKTDTVASEHLSRTGDGIWVTPILVTLIFGWVALMILKRRGKKTKKEYKA